MEHVPERPEPLPQEVFGSATLARSWAPSEAALIGACGAPNQGSLSGTSGPPCGAIGMTMGMTPDGTGFLMPSLFNLSLDLDDIDNGGARSLSAELDEAAWRSSEATRYAQLVSEARKLYPKKAGRIEHHHVAPKYLGGDKKGRTVPIDAAYHQLITNEFRRLHPYGSARPTPQRLSELMRQVYSKYPLP